MQKTVEVPQMQFIDKVIAVPMQSQAQPIDKVVDVPEVLQTPVLLVHHIMIVDVPVVKQHPARSEDGGGPPEPPN